MFKKGLIFLAIIGLAAFGCSKKVVKNEDIINKQEAEVGSKVLAGNSQGSEEKNGKIEGKAVKHPDEDKEKINGEEYIIGAEDVLEVVVWRNDMLSRRVVVRPDGKISLPLVGDIQAAGLTSNQLKEHIEKRLKEYQELPTITIIVAEINSYYIYVLGEVTRPGRYQLKSNISVLQAVSLAGGFTNWASPNSMVVLRRNGEKEEKIKVRYKKIISGSRPEENILLKAGDSIIIP